MKKDEDQEAQIIDKRKWNFKLGDQENDFVRNNISDHLNKVATQTDSDYYSYDEITAHYLEQQSYRDTTRDVK